MKLFETFFNFFLRALANRAAKKTFEIICSKKFLICIGSALMSLNFSIQNFFITHLTFTLIILTLSLTLSIWFGLKILSTAIKIPINRILVNDKGQCFCPDCHRRLFSERRASKILSIFRCEDCKLSLMPTIHKTTKVFDAILFETIQDYEPQTIITLENYDQYFFNYSVKPIFSKQAPIKA